MNELFIVIRLAAASHVYLSEIWNFC